MSVNIHELDDVNANTGSRETPDDGDYNLLIEEAKYGPNSKGTGTGYKMKLTMLDGAFAGNSIYHYINVTHPSATAQQIGRSDLKSMMLVTGVDDSDQLKDKSIRARLVGEMADYRKQNGETTKIVNLRPKLFMSLDGKNADGNDVQPFIARSPNAKEELAEWRKNNMAPSNQGAASGSGTSSGGSGTSAGQTDSSSKQDLDDEIPF